MSFAHHLPLTCGGDLTRRSPFVEPHARVLDWVLAWGCTASGLGWAGGCNPSGRPKREGCSRSTPRSLPSASKGGHGMKRADGRAEHAALAGDKHTRIECRTRVPCRLRARAVVWTDCATIACICLSPQQVDRNRHSTYESQHARDRGARQLLDSLSQSRLYFRRHGSNAALFT